MERYDRQMRIKDWNQRLFDDMAVAIIGADEELGKKVALALASVGVGTIHLFGNKEVGDSYRFLDFKVNGYEKEKRVHFLEKYLKTINPDIDVYSVSGKIGYADLRLLKKYDVVLEVSNSYYQKRILFYNPPSFLLLGSVSGDSGKISRFSNRLDASIYYENYEKFENQSELISMILAGVLSDEIILEKMYGKSMLTRPVYINFEHPSLFSPSHGRSNKKIEGNGSWKAATIVGCGALGNFIALGLSTLKEKGIVYLYDDDEIEETNLNRQVLYYDSVGRKKAKVLAEKMKKIGIETKAFVKRVGKRNKVKNVDIVFSAVDNYATRLYLMKSLRRLKMNPFRREKLLIDGGTNPFSGQVKIYKNSVDRETIKKFEAFAKNEEPHSCIYQPDPSIITSNMVIGGLMVLEYLRYQAGYFDDTVFYNVNSKNKLDIPGRKIEKERVRLNLDKKRAHIKLLSSVLYNLDLLHNIELKKGDLVEDLKGINLESVEFLSPPTYLEKIVSERINNER